MEFRPLIVLALRWLIFVSLSIFFGFAFIGWSYHGAPRPFVIDLAATLAVGLLVASLFVLDFLPRIFKGKRGKPPRSSMSRKQQEKKGQEAPCD
jgi:hypothetical protein